MEGRGWADGQTDGVPEWVRLRSPEAGRGGAGPCAARVRGSGTKDGHVLGREQRSERTHRVGEQAEQEERLAGRGGGGGRKTG